MADDPAELAQAVLRGEGASLVVELSGDWQLAMARPSFGGLVASFEEERARFTEVRISGAELLEWDSSLLVFVRQAALWAEQAGIKLDVSELPQGAQNMLRMLKAPVQGQPEEFEAGDWLSDLGRGALKHQRRWGLFLEFIGQLLLDFVALLRGRAQFRSKDLLWVLQSTGPRAVMIVSLLSFLTGLIIAFIGVIQLQKFAADIYVADLVGLAMARELGAVMVGVIMAGRTGAAFAAQIGSMQVNEEVDALTSFGISPMQFLVLPRVIALVVMMPLLCVCADVVGMLGGMVVAVTLSNVSVLQYINELEYAVSLSDFFGGIFKSGVFGLIVAVAGCYQGLTCGRDASSVGLAATSAVVTGITGIVIADAVFAVLFNIWGI